RDAACQLHLRRQRARELEIELLADVSGRGTSGDAGDQRSAGGVEAVALFSQPPGVIAASQLDLAARHELGANPQVMQVAPGDLIGESVFIVRRRIELVE